MKRGYVGIGVYCPKKAENVGTLLRSAMCFGADFTFVIGSKGLHRQASNTMKSQRHVPHYEYRDLDEFLRCLPLERTLVGVETGGRDLGGFEHPERAVYLLGSEDHGLPADALNACQHIVSIDSSQCLNVAVAGSIALYDRSVKGGAL